MSKYLSILFWYMAQMGLKERLNFLLYCIEVLSFRSLKRTFRKFLVIEVCDLIFLIKSNSGDLGIIYEIFGKKPYLVGPDFQVEEGNTCLDIGANIGCVSLQWASRNPSGLIIAVEPHPETFKRLKTNLETNSARNVVPLNVAVAKESGTVLFELNEYDNMGRVIDRKLPASSDLSAIEVVSIPLDDLIDRYCLTIIHLIKIDVEGFEVECLLGATRAMKMTEKIILEYHSEQFAQECLSILSDNGFTVARIGNLITGLKRR